MLFNDSLFSDYCLIHIVNFIDSFIVNTKVVKTKTFEITVISVQMSTSFQYILGVIYNPLLQIIRIKRFTLTGY
jgi:hypothetical protein